MGAPAIRGTPGGATLRVRVSPGAARTRIVGLHGDAVKVAVQAPPEKGRANRELIRLLAGALAVRPGDVEVVRGAAGRAKTVLVRGVAASVLRARLKAILGTLGAP